MTQLTIVNCWISLTFGVCSTKLNSPGTKRQHNYFFCHRYRLPGISSLVQTQQATRQWSYPGFARNRGSFSSCSDLEKQTYYANLKETEQFLEPYNQISTQDVLTFIEYTNFDEIIEAQHALRKRELEVKKKDKELSEAKGQLAQKGEELAGLKRDISAKTETHQK